ncbi:MAG TPA: RidA family protein [Thermoanaerobaculia bacterium]
MPKIRLNPPELFPSERYGFSQIVVAQGRKTAYLSGQVGCDEQLRMVDLHDLGAQARKALENIETAMRAAGGTRDDIVSLRIYIAGESIKNTAAVTEALTGFFHPERLPATSWIGVAALARPEFLIEIEAVAVLE